MSEPIYISLYGMSLNDFNYVSVGKNVIQGEMLFLPIDQSVTKIKSHIFLNSESKI